MDHATKLDRLPEGLQFPPRVNERIHFEPARSRLVWRGFMSKADYDGLFELHDDIEYRRALERLFQLSTEAGGDCVSHRGRTWGIVAILLGLLLAAIAWWAWLHRQ